MTRAGWSRLATGAGRLLDIARADGVCVLAADWLRDWLRYRLRLGLDVWLDWLAGAWLRRDVRLSRLNWLTGAAWDSTTALPVGIHHAHLGGDIKLCAGGARAGNPDAAELVGLAWAQVGNTLEIAAGIDVSGKSYQHPAALLPSTTNIRGWGVGAGLWLDDWLYWLWATAGLLGVDWLRTTTILHLVRLDDNWLNNGGDWLNVWLNNRLRLLTTNVHLRIARLRLNNRLNNLLLLLVDWLDLDLIAERLALLVSTTVWGRRSGSTGLLHSPDGFLCSTGQSNRVELESTGATALGPNTDSSPNPI